MRIRQGAVAVYDPLPVVAGPPSDLPDWSSSSAATTPAATRPGASLDEDASPHEVRAPRPGVIRGRLSTLM